jgi:hypothetical protein
MARVTNTGTIKIKKKREKTPPKVLQAEPDLFSPPYAPGYPPVAWLLLLLVDPTTDPKPEDSDDSSSPPSSGVSASPPAQLGAYPKIHSTVQTAFQIPLRETRGPMDLLNWKNPIPCTLRSHRPWLT